MTQAEPIPDVQYGISNWQDYINNWREKDAEWLQSRVITRFANITDRNTALASGGYGTFAWVNDIGTGEEMLTWKSKDGTWKNMRPLAQSFRQIEAATTVTLSHISAGGKGLVFNGTGTQVINSSLPFSVLTTAFTADSTGVTVKTGTRTAKLTTDAANLLLSTPDASATIGLSVPSIILTGTGSVLSAPGKTIAVGTVTADSATITNINMSGTLTGGKYTGTEATIGGVLIKSNFVTPPNNASGVVNAGFTMNNGIVYGDSTGMVMRNRVGTTLGDAWMRTGANTIQFGSDVSGDAAHGCFLDVYSQLRLRAGNDYAVQWVNDAGQVKAYMGIVVVSTAAQDAADWPNGTIWISPT